MHGKGRNFEEPVAKNNLGVKIVNAGTCDVNVDWEAFRAGAEMVAVPNAGQVTLISRIVAHPFGLIQHFVQA